MEPSSPKPGESERPTVLLVEDARDVRALLARVLDSRGWHVVTARDGLSALQLIEEFRIDALVTDLHIPGPTGEMLLEYARRRSPECRLVLLSGWVTRRARARAEAVGAAIFEKPVPLDALLEELSGARPSKA
jgi:CheY-like chemotaxis protein